MGCCHGNSNSGCCQDEVQHSHNNYNVDDSQNSAETYVCPQCGKETNLQKRMKGADGKCPNCGCASDKE